MLSSNQNTMSTAMLSDLFFEDTSIIFEEYGVNNEYETEQVSQLPAEYMHAYSKFEGKKTHSVLKYRSPLASNF